MFRSNSRLIPKRDRYRVFTLPLIFPTIMFLRIFLLDYPSFFVSGKSEEHSDSIGIFRLAQILHRLNNPFHNTYTGAPDGENIWVLQNLSQASQILLLFLFTRVFDPFTAGNLVFLLFLYISGVSVAMLLLHFSCKKFVITSAVLATQTLPEIQYSLSAYPSMLLGGFPLLIIFLALKFVTTSSNKYFYYLIFVIFISATLDAYIYNIMLILYILIIIKHLKIFKNFGKK